MRILLLSATSTEIEGFKDKLPANVDVCFTGVGPNLALTNVVKYLLANMDFNYSLILQVGLGGAFNTDVKLGSIFNVVNDQHVAGAWENEEYFRSIEAMGFNASLQLESVLSSFKGVNLEFSIPQANGLTVAIIESNKARLACLKEVYPSKDIESMEGCVCFELSHIFKIPAIQLRAISNYVGERDKTKWNFKDALVNLGSVSMDLIEQFNRIYKDEN